MKKFPMKLAAVLTVILIATVLMIPSVSQKRLIIRDDALARLKKEGVSKEVIDKLESMDEEYYPDEIKNEIAGLVEADEIDGIMKKISRHAEKKAIWHGRTITPGLDLQGGMHLVIRVKTDEAVKTRVDTIANELHAEFKKARVRYSDIKIQGSKIRIEIKETENIEGFNKVLEEEFRGLDVLSNDPKNGVVEAVLGLPDAEIENIRKWAVEQSLETIRTRIDQFGVVEPDIRIQGDDRIQIQLPGLENTENAKKVLTEVAHLEFKLVDMANRDMAAQVAARKAPVPPGDELLFKHVKDRKTGEIVKKEPFLVKKRTLLSGEYLTDARAQIDSQYGKKFYVSITFNKKGAKKFEQITGENVNKPLAIVLDGKVYSAPNINERIPGGRAQITGDFTMDEAHALAIALRAGALPAPVELLEERSVGPSLGEESINKGIVSMLVGGVMVVIFMVIYYNGAGMIANLALVANIVLILGGMSLMRATLTLPGIAGMILTIGMAVDANVLIFERIREELSTGKTPYSAVAAGYNRATLTILDANVTTLIAALVLGQFGTGPVRGFAVTLSLGVMSSMFTALVLTRIVFDYLLLDRKMKKISI